MKPPCFTCHKELFCTSSCIGMNKPQQTNMETPKVKVTPELVQDIIDDGGASAIEAAKEQLRTISSQMDLDLANNKSGILSSQIKLTISFTIDSNNRNFETEGTYGYAVPNLSHTAGKKKREIPDPNQPAICGNCGKQDCQLCSKDAKTIETGGKTKPSKKEKK